MTNQPPPPRWNSSTWRTFWRGVDVVLLCLLALLAWWLGVINQSALVVFAYFVVSFSVLHNILLWVAIPFNVRRTKWLTASPEYTPFDPHDPDLPNRIGESIEATAKALRPHGFRVVAHLFTEVHGSRIADFATVFDNHSAGDIAVFWIGFVGGVTDPQSRFDGLKFVAEFSGGNALVTQRDDSPSTLPLVGPIQSFNFPGETNPGRLYRLHRALIVRYGNSSSQKPLLGDDAVAHYRGWETEWLRRLASEGYVYLDATYPVYRLTVKGVYRVLWHLRWPMRAIFEANAQRRTTRLLRELSTEQ
jgi:hypothetical protein